MSDGPRARVGTDVGGTFTDIIAVLDDERGVIAGKVPTVPSDQSVGFADALRSYLPEDAVLVDVVHGTTASINAILERRTAPVGLLCTEGHPDILDVRRIWRPHLFGNWWNRPPSLIPRRHRVEISERVDANGEVLVPLEEDAVRSAGRRLYEAGIRSFCVAYLNSYLNPIHEQRTQEILLEELGHDQGVTVTISTDILPEIQEYERTSTAAVAAMLRPVMGKYVANLDERLQSLGAHGLAVRIMRSNAGLMSSRAAAMNPVPTLMSGPAGGVRASIEIGRLMGAQDIITFDMGGTSTDVALIEHLRPLEAMERDIEWNIPVRTPMLDIHSIGAGGGSIAWVDAAGALHVGPESAGAVPGPACYGRGGAKPTFTDASLVLGRIDPDYFLGGAMKLDVRAAVAALESLDVRADWGPTEIAHAVHRISLAKMSLLVREVSVNRGYDPRDFTLMCFGGAGGLAAAEVARELGIRAVCVPRNAGVFSALGGLLSDLVYDDISSHVAMASKDAVADIERRCELLLARARERATLDRESGEGVHSFMLDMRYVGSSHDLTVPLHRRDRVRWDDLAEACEEFKRRHLQLFGFERPHDSLQLSAVRLRTTLPREKPTMQTWADGGKAQAAERARRPVWFTEGRGFLECPVYERDGIAAGERLTGPCVIEETDCVTVVHPDQAAHIDDWGSIIITNGVG